MSDASEKQADGRRERKERRKPKFLPFFGKNQRKAKVAREADVLEIYIPPLQSEQDRRDKATRRTKPR
jgi:hypothetical protein